jgi:hypothetical protein
MNDVPVDYYAGVDMTTGRRTDEAQRPELSFGSVEYVAPTEYMVSALNSVVPCERAWSMLGCAAAPCPLPCLLLRTSCCCIFRG